MATWDDIEQTDAQLVAACRGGDALAWQALVNRYQRLVYSIPRKAGLDDDACADVFQQVFTRLVEHLPRLEQPDRLGPWLVITAKREAWRVSRKMLVATASPSKAEDDDDNDPLEHLPATDPLPDEVLAEMQEQHTIRLMLASLDERCRRLLSLLFYRPDPLPYSEVAITLGVPEGSVGPTRARCLQKLRKLLADKLK